MLKRESEKKLKENESWQGFENRDNVKMIKRLARRSQKAQSEFKSIELTEQKIQDDREADAKRNRKKRSQHKADDDNRRKKNGIRKRLKRISNWKAK